MNVRFYLLMWMMPMHLHINQKSDYDLTLKSHLWSENLSLCTQQCYGRHYIALLQTTSGLSILIYGVISLMVRNRVV